MNKEFKQYLAGFFDGDGCICIEKQKDSYVLRIKFSQSDLKWIQKIKEIYPILHISGGYRHNNNRTEYQLRAAGRQIENIIDDLLPYVIIKYEQMTLAKKFIQYINVKNTSQEKEEIYVRMKDLKKNGSIQKLYERLDTPYIAGLFDSDGTVGIYKNYVKVGITQKSDICILHEIAKIYDAETESNMRKDNDRILFPAHSRVRFLTDVLPHCLYKNEQIELALEFLKETNSNVRNDMSKQMKEIKKVDNAISNTEMNQEEYKKYLKRCFCKFQEMDTTDLIIDCKYKEICETKENKTFENKIFNLKNWENFNIDPELEFCENAKQCALYNYFRKKVSSLPVTGVIGRSFRILVKDKFTNKYIGLMCMSSDVYNLGERDKFFGITKDNKKLLNNILNLSCCVPLQPFGYNTNGGKLLASLAFSKEIFDYYLKKYNEPLLGITTTSINGKSIQYDRLECLKLVGYTKGFGSVYFPDKLYDICKEYNNIWKIKTINNRVDRFDLIKQLLIHLELPNDIMKHGKKRGIYCGYLFSSKFEKDYNTNELKNVQYIYDKWKKRWCDNRLENLIKNDRIKTEFGLYTIEKFKTMEWKRYENAEIEKNGEKIFTYDLVMRILKMKDKLIKYDEICETLNKELPFNITKTDVSFIYNGKIEPKHKDEEYNKLLKTKPFQTKTVRKTKIIREEILDYIIKQRTNGVVIQKIKEYVKNQYDTIVSATDISKICMGEIEFLDTTSRNVLENKKEYIELVEKKIKRIFQNGKYTEDEKLYIKSTNEEYEKIVIDFKEIYDKNISIECIKRIRKCM